MKKHTRVETLVGKLSGERPARVETETERLLRFGWERGWDFDVVGCGPSPGEHFRSGDWIVVPRQQDLGTEIPAFALERVSAVYEAGFRPVDWVIAHEAPDHALPGPVEKRPTPQERLAETTERTQAWFEEIAEPTGELVKGMAKVLGIATVAAIGVAGLAVLAFPLLLVGALASGLDPMLIAVMPDGEWVCIAWWRKKEDDEA